MIPFIQYEPGESKNRGGEIRIRPDWEQVKIDLMEKIVRAKFTQHPELAWRLPETGDKILMEGNDWGNTYWGVDVQIG